jgi:hypothetical protein
MKCPHCKREIPGSPCPDCGAVMPENADYCMECGSFMGRSGEIIEGDGSEFDFENRVLCPDGNCIGIIVNGKCTECGRSYKGKKKTK